VDKGYHNGKTNRNLQTSQHHHCSTLEQGKVTKTVRLRIIVAQFQYNQDTDTYKAETLKLQAVGMKTTDRDSYNFKIPNSQMQSVMFMQVSIRPQKLSKIVENKKQI
jgi:hypothetical protein